MFWQREHANARSAEVTNQEIANLLESIANLLILKGEDAYRIRAYSQAAREITYLDQDVEDLWREGKLQVIPGVGESIAAKIDEYLRTGRSSYYEGLRAEIAPEAPELLDVPGIGPVKAREIFSRLGITTIAELEQAAREHRLSTLPGIKERTEEKILREIARLRQRTRRLLLGDALPVGEEVRGLLAQQEAVQRVDLAGSLRRMRETIGDVDLLAASDRPEEVTAAFARLPIVQEVLAVGPTKASVLTTARLQVDVRVVRPAVYGSALQYFTGSKQHNIALRDIAIGKGYRLSEYGLFDESTDRRIAGATEEEVYRALGLDWMPPEIRENRGEIEAAAAGRLPRLLEAGDIRGDLHCHTDWSDGEASVEAMALAARDLGYEYLAITDHSPQVRVAGGLPPERVRQQAALIADLNRRLAPFRVLHGAEVDIRGDGRLDYPDDLLATLDFVGVSVHSGFEQPALQMTERILRAIRNPLVCALCHPTGRLIERRQGYAVDVERIVEVAAEEGVALEINGQPQRLDLDDVWSRRAMEAGVTLVCSTDAHSTRQLQSYMRYAIAVARRGWIEARHVLNAQPVEAVLELRARRRRRRAA